MFVVGLLYMAFIMLRYVLSMPAFWRIFFYHKWVLHFVFGFNYIKVSLDWLKKYFIKKPNFNYDKLNVCTKLFSLGLDQSKILL